MDFRSRSDGGAGGRWASMATRAVLASAAVVSAAVALRVAGPSLVGFLVADIPRAYASVRIWLRPPYLYLVINGIIISIAASCRFQKQQHSAAEPPPLAPSPLEVMSPVPVPPQEYEVKLAEDAPPRNLYDGVKAEADSQEEVAQEEKEIVESRTVAVVETSTEYAATEKVKPLVSTLFSHRKVAKTSPEGKALGVARRPRRNETLESIWRTITEERAMPLVRHLKKPDTWNTGGGGEEESAATKAKAMGKTERLKAGAEVASPKRGGSRLRKERSVGQDELNRRVEAFIRKFNEEMRLQRQESLKNYMEMMDRGSH